MKNIFLILNFKTVMVSLLSVVSTYVCIRYQLTGDFPFTIIATAVVFPIVFSIGGAYSRRENALDEYGIMKAHGRALYYATRDWTETADRAAMDKVKKLLGELFNATRDTFISPQSQMREKERAIYRAFSDLSAFVKTDLRGKGLPSGECSRANQYISKMMVSFENVKHIYQYRTPRTLKAFSTIFILLLPFVYGPYFAHLAKESASGLAYVMPVIFSVVLVALDNIQSHLENPFDQVGEDDIYINVEKFIDGLEA